MLVGPRLEHKGGGRLELRHVKVRPTVICAFIALIAALTADSKHHRDVLRCATHERHNKREDNDCVVTSSPRGVCPAGLQLSGTSRVTRHRRRPRSALSAAST